MKITAVIMAGGKGERFWPKSRGNLPKQFLSLSSDGNTMIQMTARRLLPVVEYEDMFIVTNKDYVKLVKEQLPQIPSENILAEPMGRNTAPCIGFAAAVISQKYDEAMMLVLASDHIIGDEEAYVEVLKLASKTAEIGENLVTIGIMPTYPETGYGYINFLSDEEQLSESKAYLVRRFVEKPDIETAKKYLDAGDYLWNSGMFIWKASTILNKLKELMPDTYKGCMEIGEAFGKPEYEKVLEASFTKFKSESIDYGVMEKAGQVYTIPGSFGWDDVGGWLALERINETDDNGNVKQGDVVTVGTKNTIVAGGSKLVAVVGIDDIIIVDTDDAILICAKDSTQDVKKVIEDLKANNRNELI